MDTPVFLSFFSDLLGIAKLLFWAFVLFLVGYGIHYLIALSQQRKKEKDARFVPQKRLGPFVYDLKTGRFKTGQISPIYHFDQVRDAELIERVGGIEKQAISLAGALVGGALFGTAGAILGGLSGPSELQEVADFVGIRVYFHAVDLPPAMITLYQRRRTKERVRLQDHAETAAQILHLLAQHTHDA